MVLLNLQHNLLNYLMIFQIMHIMKLNMPVHTIHRLVEVLDIKRAKFL